jgi:hypothetical protein
VELHAAQSESIPVYKIVKLRDMNSSRALVVSVSKQIQFQCPQIPCRVPESEILFLQVPNGSVQGDVMAVLYIDVEYVKNGRARGTVYSNI